jgi:tripeptide aminopeptidase
VVNEDRLVQEFLELVKIDSPTFKERRMADCLKGKLEALGLEVYEDKAGEKYNGEAGNVIGKLKGNREGPAVLFLAHMDRVEPGTGIDPVVAEGIIKSRGQTILGGDDCAGIAAILEALRLLKENGDAHGDIEVAFTIAEEGGLFGAKALDPGQLQAKIAYTFDSTGPVGSLVVQAPAQDGIKIVIRGKASHAGVAPEEGVNAIQAAALAIAKLQVGRIDKETTSNIGIIKGGQATNIVPDQVEIEGEVRSLVEARVDEETRKMAEVFTREVAAFGGQVEFRHERLYSSFLIKEEEEVSRRAAAALTKLKLTPERQALGGGSDANILNARGIRTLNLGNGSQKVHTTGEYIAVKDLVKSAEFCHALMTV